MVSTFGPVSFWRLRRFISDRSPKFLSENEIERVHWGDDKRTCGPQADRRAFFRKRIVELLKVLFRRRIVELLTLITAGT